MPSRRASTWRPTLRRSAARARRYSSSRPSQSSAVRSITSCHARAAERHRRRSHAWSGTGARRPAGRADGRRRSPPRRRPPVPRRARAGGRYRRRPHRARHRARPARRRCRAAPSGIAQIGRPEPSGRPDRDPGGRGIAAHDPGPVREDGRRSDTLRVRRARDDRRSRARRAPRSPRAPRMLAGPTRRPRSRDPASHRASRRRSSWRRRRVPGRSSVAHRDPGVERRRRLHEPGGRPRVQSVRVVHGQRDRLTRPRRPTAAPATTRVPVSPRCAIFPASPPRASCATRSSGAPSFAVTAAATAPSTIGASQSRTLGRAAPPA